jgi:transcriptional regulator with XRE-family HTH domain
MRVGMRWGRERVVNNRGTLAEVTGFHPGSIDRIESGLTEPSLTMLVTLEKAFGLSVAAID